MILPRSSFSARTAPSNSWQVMADNGRLRNFEAFCAARMVSDPRSDQCLSSASRRGRPPNADDADDRLSNFIETSTTRFPATGDTRAWNLVADTAADQYADQALVQRSSSGGVLGGPLLDSVEAGHCPAWQRRFRTRWNGPADRRSGVQGACGHRGRGSSSPIFGPMRDEQGPVAASSFVSFDVTDCACCAGGWYTQEMAASSIRFWRRTRRRSTDHDSGLHRTLDENCPTCPNGAQGSAYDSAERAAAQRYVRTC